MSGTLLHSPADIVAKLLMDLGQGIDSQSAGDWPVFVSQERNAPDNCITIYDTQGVQHGSFQSTGEVPEHHGFQVRLRSALPKPGYAKARAVAVALDESVDWRTVSLDGTTYTVFAATRKGSVLPLGDEPGTKRQLFTINYLVSLIQN